MWDKNQGKYCLTGDLYPFFSHSGYKSLVNQCFLSFTVSGGEMTLVDEETGDKYLFARQDDGADVEAVVAAGLRGLWSSEELGRVIDPCA